MMRPAFSSPQQAAAFGLMLLALLLAPALAGNRFLPPRQEIYSSIWWASGDYPYFYQQIFQEKGDIDVLFIGASHMHTAFNTPYVQEQFSKALGRPAVARTFGWGWTGYDQVYWVVGDLLAHRKVKMLVIDDFYDNGYDVPHPLATRLFRFGENAEALDGLPIHSQAAYYLASIVGMPHNLLGLVRANFPPDLSGDKKLFPEIEENALNPVTQLGALTEQLGFSPNRAAFASFHPAFVAFTPQNGIRPSDVSIYSPETKTNFVFDSSLPPMELHFAQKIAALAQQNNCKLVMVHVPFFNEEHSPVIYMPVYWPEALHANLTMLGIPPATLFEGLTEDDVRKLYSDPIHLSQNGQNYFTSLMMPNLLNIYESKIQEP
jgi:hypothetical protein